MSLWERWKVQEENHLTSKLRLRKSSGKSYSALHRGSWPSGGAAEEKLGQEKALRKFQSGFHSSATQETCMLASRSLKTLSKYRNIFINREKSYQRVTA